MKTNVVRVLKPLALATLLLTVSAPAPAQTNFGYTYDALGRVKIVTYPDGSTVAYDYDAAGNRTQKVSAPYGSAFTQTIQVTGYGPVNLRTLANTAGYNGSQNATITFEVGNGVTIMGDPGGGIGMDTGTWPSGYTIALSLVVKNGGAVYGGGGNGGAGAATFSSSGDGGETGGDAIYARTPISITVQSGANVAGGGTGGTGGAGADWYDVYNYTDYYWGGGGGGGGFPNGTGGAGGYIYNWQYYSGYDGNPGSDGTTSGGGAGGAGLSGSPTYYTTSGATGGGPGGGYAIRKNGHSVPVSNSGTISGAQS